MIKLYSIVYKEINQLVHCGLFSFYTFSFLTIILLIRTSQDKPNHSFFIPPLTSLYNQLEKLEAAKAA